MGNFYTNVTVVNVTPEKVRDELATLNRDAYIFGDGRVSVVYDRESDEQNTEILAALAEHLATRFETAAFAVLNHDDDDLWFQLYVGSDLVAEYGNRGGPHTNVRALAKVLAPESQLRVRFVLVRPYTFQIDRHEALLKLFHFPEACLLGYEYVDRGERTDDMAARQLLRVSRQG